MEALLIAWLAARSYWVVTADTAGLLAALTRSPQQPLHPALQLLDKCGEYGSWP